MTSSARDEGRAAGGSLQPMPNPYRTPTVRTTYSVRVTRADGVVIFEGSITDDDHFHMEQTAGKSTTVSLTATAAIEGLLAHD